MKDKFSAAVVVYKDDSGKTNYKVVSLEKATDALHFYSTYYRDRDASLYECEVRIDLNSKL